MAGTGTGVPNWFRCPAERVDANNAYDYHARRFTRPVERHVVVRTGRTRTAPNRRKGHPRKDARSHEYDCLTCGHHGWSCLKDILTKPVRSAP
jgi:hypothetical protein